jgi:hypothetical protein
MSVLKNIRSWRRKFRKKREAIVTIQLPAEQNLAAFAVEAAELAVSKGLTGEEAREFAIKSVASNIEKAVKGNPEHPVGRFIEVLDGVIGLVVETAYQAAMSSKSGG